MKNCVIMSKRLIHITESDIYSMVTEALSILREDTDSNTVSDEDIVKNGKYSLAELVDIAKNSLDANEYQQFLSICKKAIESHVNSYTVDNFDLVSKLMTFNSDDDFYFCEIIKRKKDNPNDNFHYRLFIASYWITSQADLQSKKDEIINTCIQNNARAYIYMNPRSAKIVNDYANNVLKPRFAQKGKGFGKWRGHELEVAAGQHKDWDDRPISFIDIDIAENEKHKVTGMLGKDIWDRTFAELKANGITPLSTYKTPNGGIHILLPDKNARNIDFSWADGGVDRGQYATVHWNYDSPTLLYSSTKPQGY